MERPVDINKLKHSTMTVDKRSPSLFLDFSKFATENFDQRLALINQPLIQNIKSTGKVSSNDYGNHRTNNKRSIVKSKLLYNEAQRTSVDFGISGSEMRHFHEMRMSLRTLKHHSTVSGDTLDSEQEMTSKDSLSSPSLLLKTTDESKISLNSPTSFNTTQDVQISKSLDEDEDSHVLHIEIPKRRDRTSLTTRSSSNSISSISKVEPHFSTIEPQINTQTNGVERVIRRVDSGLLKRSFSVSSKGTSSSGFESKRNSKSKLTVFKKRSQSSLNSLTPSQRECHSVEDTLRADEDFKDFSIPSKKLSYYDKPLETPNFEKANSHEPEEYSQLKSTYNSPVSFCEYEEDDDDDDSKFVTPNQSPNLRKRSSTRSFLSGLDEFGSNATHWSPSGFSIESLRMTPERISQKPSSIKIITEDEILNDYSRMSYYKNI